MPWSEAAAGICAGHIFLMRKKKRPKYATRFWTPRFFNDGVQHGQNLLRELNIEDGSGSRSFVRMTKSDFEILLKKIGPIIQWKYTKYREAIPASIRLAVTLRYLVSGDSFTSLTYTSKFLSSQYP
jgi:hypothetical protein